MERAISDFFRLKENGTTVRREVLAGATTFFTMSYIIFVNPSIMSETGMDHGAIFVGTCLAAAVACFFMGLFANWPVALAPGMGLNAYFTYVVVGEMGYSWQTALAAVFIAGILFFIISVTPLRRWMLESIPSNLRIALGAGVGLFIGFIGLQAGGIVVANPATYLSVGDMRAPETLLAVFGFLLITVLSVKNVPGSIILGILGVTVLALVLGLVEFSGFVSSPPSIAPVFLELNFSDVLNLSSTIVVLTFLFVNLFDTAGTLLAVATRAKLVGDDGQIKNLDRALKADSSASVVGVFFGCAPVTSYVESSSGIAAGGRTGLTAVVVGLLFCGAIFFSPIASIVPAYATAGALIYVAILMVSGMESLEWTDPTELLPALITIVLIPLTFSIADGIAFGFTSYVVLKLFTGQREQISWGAWFLAILFISKFAFI